ncbi:Blp family class II bacteriocin [uncultured Shewanella sp.]|uniref:Blp family class II bacteriocin n=1 Tax=uncultured Shewanella sp. TaxID=173975 RepID=UPI00261EC939|nr:Blp family class II bacteriocin [uncultured Shewanella sp.]
MQVLSLNEIEQVNGGAFFDAMSSYYTEEVALTAVGGAVLGAVCFPAWGVVGSVVVGASLGALVGIGHTADMAALDASINDIFK